MNIIRVFKETPEIRRLWEENMQEKWTDYDKATKFIQKDAEGKIIGGFAIYWDDSDGISGHFISGWSARKNLDSVVGVIKHIAQQLGEVYIKTDKRQMKIVAGKIGELVKNCDPYVYYIVRGN